MSDLNVSVIGNTTERIAPQMPDKVQAAEHLKEQNAEDSSRKEHIKEVLEDVIAKSKDGDTAQASKTSKDMLKESEELGEVKKMPDKPKDNDGSSATKKLMDEIKASQEDKPSPAEKMKESMNRAEQLKKTQDNLSTKNTIQKKEDVHTQNNTAAKKNSPVQNNNESKNSARNMDSYSDAQLQQMYVNGDISRYDYDHQMSRREERNSEEANNTRNEKVFNEGIVRAMEKEREADISANAIDEAFSEEANDNLKAEQRMAMLDAAEL